MSRAVGRWQRAIDVSKETDPVAVVQEVFVRGKTTTIIAASGTGKSFTILSLASAISAGEEWCGRAVTQGSVVIIHFEGDALGKRIRALEKEGRDVANIYIIRPRGSISPRVERNTAIELPSEVETDIKQQLHDLAGHLEGESLPPVVLVVLDTLRASLSGSEDSSENVSAYFRAAERIAAAANAAAAPALGIVHHSGWLDGDSAKARERGSSALRGNVDITVYLSKGKTDPALAALGKHELFLETQKLRDDEEPEKLALIRRKVYLPGEDSHGNPISSCVVEGAEPHTEMMLRRVLVAIRDHPAITSKEELAKVVGKQRTHVAVAFDQAVGAGLVAVPVRKAAFSLTSKGLGWFERG